MASKVFEDLMRQARQADYNATHTTGQWDRETHRTTYSGPLSEQYSEMEDDRLYQLALEKARRDQMEQLPSVYDTEKAKADAGGLSFTDLLFDRILGVDRTQVTGGDTDWGKLAVGALRKGANQWNALNWETANMLFGNLAQKYHDTDFAKDIRAITQETYNGFVDALNYIPGVNLDYAKDNDTNFITRMYRQATKGRDAVNEYYAANANTSRAAQIVDTFGTSTIAAVPMALEAWLLAPAQAAQAGAATTQGLSYFSGLQTAKGAEATGMMLRHGLKELVKNPQFWTSYLQSAGDGYESALQDGMNETDAKVYGLVNGFFNSMIEIGGADEALGGIQNLPMRLQQTGGKHALVEWFKDAVLGEGKEEVLQGIFERGGKSLFGQDVPLYSLDPNDDRAILNPYTAAQEFTGGAVVGALLGAGQTAAQKAVRGGMNAAANAIDTRVNQAAQQEETRETGEQFVQQIISNLGVSEQDAQILSDGLNIGDTDPQAYGLGIQEAFKLGQLGLSYEQARESAVFANKLTEPQFRHAFEIGSMQGGNTAAVEDAGPQRPITRKEYGSIEEFSQEFEQPERVREIFDSVPETDLGAFTQEFQTAYDMGQSGVSANYLTEANIPTLTPEQARAAFDMGRENAAAGAEEVAETFGAQQRQGNLQRVRGTVKGEGVSIADLKKTFNDSQNTAYRLLTRFADVTGVNIVLYNSQADPNTGLFPESQGMFKWKNDTIYVDINSGMFSSKDVNSLGKYTMLRTFAHEFTHFIEKWNPKEYNAFREFIFSTMESRGSNVHDMIEQMMLLDSSGQMTYEEASREVVAESMVDVLQDSTLVQQLAEENPNLFRTILRKLKQFAARIKQYYRGLTKSPEAEALKENGAYLDGIVKMWDSIAKGAVENYQRATAEELYDQPARPENLPSRAQETSKSNPSQETRRAGMDFFRDVEVEEEQAPDLRQMVQRPAPETRRAGMDFFRTGEYGETEEEAPNLRGMVQRAPLQLEARPVARDRFPANDFTSQAEEAPSLRERATQVRPVSRDRFPANDLTSMAEQGEDLRGKVQRAPVQEETVQQGTPEGAKLRARLEAENTVDFNGYRYEIFGMKSATVNLREGGVSTGSEYRGTIREVSGGSVPVANGRAIFDRTFDNRAEAVDYMVSVAENNHLLEEREETDGRSDGTSEKREAGNDNARMDEGSEGLRRGEPGREAASEAAEVQQTERSVPERGDRRESNVPERAGQDRAGEAVGNGRADRNGNGSGRQERGNAGSTDRKNGRAVSGVQSTVPIKPRGKQNVNNYRIEEDIDSIRPNFQDNYNAIKLVKQLIAENRPATEEERKVLAKYKGWGGLKNYVLDRNGYYGRMLQAILTPEEYETARDSVLNAHYTSTKVIDGIYRAVQRMGFKGGNILEPSMGVGNFFGKLPQNLSTKSSLYGVELDRITGTIAKNLYPDAKIDVAGFQDILYGDDTFDLVVGNVPFSNDIKIPYRGTKFNLHDFFFVKALDETRPGGVLALITSTGTLDKLSGKTQKAIADRANLVAAFRLPDNAFLSNAGTSVTTDLIFLQKKGPGVPDNGISFTEIGKLDGVPINEYYVEHPENVLGDLAYEKGMYAAERTVVHATNDFEQRFNKAMDSLPKNIMNVDPDASKDVTTKKRGQKTRTTYTVTDKGAALVDSEGKKTVLSGKQAEIVKQYTEIKQLYFATAEAEQNGNIKAADEYRKKLNRSYDAFTKKYGSLEKNKKLLGKDDEFLRVSGLEIIDKENNVTKSAIFERPTMYREKKSTASSSSEGLTIVLNESGKVDVDEIARLTGKTVDDVVSDLADEIIFTPDGNYELIPVYLSGNIYQKLDAVEGRKGFERQAELLRTAIPKQKTAQEIDAEISSHWIPPKYISQFIQEKFQPYGRAEAKYIKELGKWDIEKFYSPIKKWGTNRVDAFDLLINTLNNKKIVVYDKKADGSRSINIADTKIAQNKQNDLRNEFRDWIFKDSDRSSELVDIFNRTLNAYAPLNFNALADKIDFGIDPSSSIKLRDYQKAAVARIVFGGNTLLHHGVGTGKTATMITAAHVLKSTGISQKPMFVVPNGKVLDFKREILGMYPGARILALDADLLSPKELKRTKALIATNDWDYVLVHKTGFQKIGVSPETTAAFIEQQLEDLETAIRETGATEKRGTRFEKGLISKKKNLEEKLKKILESPKDDSAPFETMGIDALFVDEAHNFKKVGFATTQQVSGVDAETNAITTDLYMKENWLRERGGRIVLATATPITNTVSEMYNMTLHVNPDILREAGVYAFDGWLNTFGDLRSDLEIASDGKTFRMKERIQDFKNGNELISLYRQFADVKQTKDVVKGLPEAEEVTVVCKGSDIHQALLDTFAVRMESAGRGSDSNDNALNVNNDAKAAATDLRMVAFLVEELFPGTSVEDLDLPDSKINKAVGNIVDEYHKSTKSKGTQLVFLDSGMGRGKSTKYTFNLYGDLISKLVKNGIPREEIADIGDYDGDTARQKLYDLVNEGKIRVLIGSTQKMGEGVNVQNKIVALHHLSVPMRADNLEQRNGRAIRHGNENKNVRIYKYIQEQSYDSYLWQMIERKSRYMAQALNGGDASDLEEISEVTVNAQQSKAIATGNPAIMEKFKLEDEVSTLRTLESAFLWENREAARTAATSKATIEECEDKVTSLEKVQAVLDKNRKEEFELNVGGQVFDKRADAAPVFFLAYAKDGAKDLGSIYGLKITKYKRVNGDSTDTGIIFNDNPDTFVEMGDSPEGNITRLVNGLDRIQGAIDWYNKRISNLKKTVADAEKTAARKEFPQQKELNEKLARLDELNEELGIKSDTVEINVTSAEGEEDEDKVQYSRGAMTEEEQNDAGGQGEGRVQFSRRVTNPETLKFLNDQLENGEVVRTYKTFLELEVNGEKKLYPPMASRQKADDGTLKMANAMAVGEWEESVGNPNSKNIFYEINKKGEKVWKYNLNKEDSSRPVPAAYDPYQHSSDVVLNDQFDKAYARPNLVTYECVIPKSELTSGYWYREARNDGEIVTAALPVGMHPWKKGSVAGKLKNTNRQVYLTRWLMPVRKLENSEVARMYKEILDREDTEVSVPFNVVPPGLQAELEKIGVPIDYEGSPSYRRWDKEKFPPGKPIVQNSMRRESLTDREILERAAQGFDAESLTDGEKNALNIFNNTLEKLKAEQEHRQELGRQYKDQQFTRGGSRAEADKIRAAMSISDSKIRSLENRLLSMENKEMLKRVLQKARTVVEAEERKHGDEKLRRYRERRNESDATRRYRERVFKEVETLRKWMMTPSNKDVRAHVPAEIQKTVVDLLDSINLMSKTALRTGGVETTKADEKYLKNMMRLRDAIKHNVDSKGLYSGYNDLPDGFIDQFDAMISGAENYIRANNGSFIVNAMTASELKSLSDMLKTLRKYIVTMNQFHNNAMFEHAYEAGEETIQHLAPFTKSKKSGTAYKFMRFDYMRPSYAFTHFGRGGESIEHEFREGQATQAFLAKKIIAFAESTYSGKEVKAWSEETKTFTTSDGETVTMPVADLMSLYCLNKRAQALTHIYGDGIRVANYKDGRNVQIDEGHVVSIGDVQRMIGTLTQRQKDVADALQKYMSTVGSEMGNYVSMRRFGVEQFTEPNYFPINSDGRYISTTADESPDNAGLYALLNSSFTKEIKENADNRIILYNIFDVFANHMASMTQYRSFALPVLDALKWFNYKNDTTSVRTKLSSAFGAPLDERAGSGAKGYAEQFVINLLKAYNGTAAQGDPYDSKMLRWLHRYNGAAIAFNLRVIIQQPAAIARAAMILSPARLAKGLGMSVIQLRSLANEMEAHSGIAAWKSLGFYDTNISRGLTELIKQNPTALDKIMEKGTAGAEAADRLTWAAMWHAAKETVRRSNYASEKEYFKAVTDLFEEVIYKTQVVDSLLTKAEFLRSKGALARQLGSFMSEPSATMSMLADAHFKYTDDLQRGMSRSEAWKKNGGNIAKTAAVYAVGQVILAAMQAVIDAWRDNDDKDPEDWLNNYLLKYVDAFKGNVIEELLPFGKIPVVSEIYEQVKSWLDYAGVFDKIGLDLYGNDISSGLTMYLKYVNKATQTIIDKAVGNKTNYTDYSIIYNLMRGVSNLTGIPVATAWREAQDVWNNTVGFFAPSYKLKTYESAKERKAREGFAAYVQATGLSQGEYKAIFDAADPDGDGIEQGELGPILQEKLQKGELNRQQADAIWAVQEWKTDFQKWNEKNGGQKAAEKTSEKKTESTQAVPKTEAKKTEASTKPASNSIPVYSTKREATLAAKPAGMSEEHYAEILRAADTDGNSSLKQDELGAALKRSVERREMSHEEAKAVWDAQGWSTKHSYEWWLSRH